MRTHDIFEDHSKPQVRVILEARANSKLRIQLRDGDTFILTSFIPIDSSIYSESGGWTCHVIEPLSGRHPQFHKLFHPGSGIDILEEDIHVIHDHESGELLYQETEMKAKPDAAPNAAPPHR